MKVKTFHSTVLTADKQYCSNVNPFYGYEKTLCACTSKDLTRFCEKVTHFLFCASDNVPIFTKGFTQTTLRLVYMDQQGIHCFSNTTMNWNTESWWDPSYNQFFIHAIKSIAAVNFYCKYWATIISRVRNKRLLYIMNMAYDSTVISVEQFPTARWFQCVAGEVKFFVIAKSSNNMEFCLVFRLFDYFFMFCKFYLHLLR